MYSCTTCDQVHRVGGRVWLQVNSCRAFETNVHDVNMPACINDNFFLTYFEVSVVNIRPLDANIPGYIPGPGCSKAD